MGSSVRSRREQGNALVLAVLILLALSSVGVVSIQYTNTDLMVAGNVARAVQAHIAGEAGMQHGLAKVGLHLQEHIGKLEQQRQAGAAGAADGSLRLGLLVFEFSTAVPDPSGVDIAQHIPMVDGDIELARMRQDVAYDLQIMYVREFKGMPGYDADADICHEVFDFNARGGIPTTLQSVAATLGDRDKPGTSDTMVLENRAQAASGPVKCTKL